MADAAVTTEAPKTIDILGKLQTLGADPTVPVTEAVKPAETPLPEVDADQQRKLELQTFRQEGETIAKTVKNPLGQTVYERLLEVDDPELRASLRDGYARRIACEIKGFVKFGEDYNYEDVIKNLDELSLQDVVNITAQLSSYIQATTENFRKHDIA